MGSCKYQLDKENNNVVWSTCLGLKYFSFNSLFEWLLSVKNKLKPATN